MFSFISYDNISPSLQMMTDCEWKRLCQSNSAKHNNTKKKQCFKTMAEQTATKVKVKKDCKYLFALD